MRLVKCDDPESSNKNVLYRYHDHRVYDYWFAHSIKLRLVEYPIIKETPCGFWIKTSYWNPDEKMWVSKNGKRSYAKQSKKLALESYIARKKRQIEITESHLAFARLGLSEGKRMLDKLEETNE